VKHSVLNQSNLKGAPFICLQIFQHYDVAIVVMDSPVTYANNIRPICLASGGNFEGESVTVTGWGLLRENGPRVR